MFDPIATYRIQFHAGFTFKHLENVIPYLRRLGIKTVYASPIFEAVPGSMHGYDAVNPNKINPELGTLKDLIRVSKKLRAAGMSWIQDIVPNHMGFHHTNEWLMDVLKKGEQSVYRNHFDIIASDLAKEPLMLPFLGADLDEVISNKELILFDNSGENMLKYHDNLWPLREGTDVSLTLQEIVAQQYYRPCNYRESYEHINYRRFFTVNSLICLNSHLKQVFDDYHSFTKKLMADGIIDGLRIDHLDGLYDPTAYLHQLRELCGNEAYIVVEKILEPGERLPKDWPIQGTTGYDFLGSVNQVFTNEKAEKRFNKLYKGLGKFNSPINTQIHRKKKDFLNSYMKGELENLTLLFVSLANRTFDKQETYAYKELVADFLIKCPVYRFYNWGSKDNNPELEIIEEIFDSMEDRPGFKEQRALFRSVLYADDGRFFLRIMQFTGPLMAKGVEDTLMYTFNRFIGNNEVGDSPEVFGISIEEFHDRMWERQAQWPLAMNASATHDTKRGEDARARLNALTGLKDAWTKEVSKWQELNKDLKQKGSPEANDEYFIYQHLVSTYPQTEEEQSGYKDRFLEYIEKALREAKNRSSWENPDTQYEASCKTFIVGLLDHSRNFWARFSAFHQRICDIGKLNSLAALILKHTCPGIPDTYQGSELWDLSMVDPDNRRPVDYEHRLGLLEETEKDILEFSELWRTSSSGKIKLFTLRKMLELRNAHPLVFSKGLYIPLALTGAYAEQVIAYARRYKEDWVVVVVPINCEQAFSDYAADPSYWADTTLILPDGIPKTYVERISKITGDALNEVKLSSLFQQFPLAVLHFQAPKHTRKAGVLMHVSSLPSSFGIGDFGPGAKTFVNSMVAAGQKYWQVLPMNPLTRGQSYSPYSATSVMAGTPLLISPEELEVDGLLIQEELDHYALKAKRRISFEKVERLKTELLDKAYRRFKQLAPSHPLKKEFHIFCEKESYWLDEYARYEALKQENSGNPWYDWTNQESTGDWDLNVKFQQYIFSKQWFKLKDFANAQGVSIIGDIPFYTALDSADVWSNPTMFSISGEGKVIGAAGVPPDYFNEDGQLWGMPVYDWSAMSADGYKWWLRRIQKNMELYDLIRLDHFRAFSEYWEVPGGSSTAKEGRWKPGPGKPFFDALLAEFGSLPLIAEDLGEISPDVFELRDHFSLPGMKVLQFAFGDDMPESIHAPHNFKDQHCVAYTGTHDNNTTLGWYLEDADRETKERLKGYTGKDISKSNVADTLIRLAYASVANIVIVPMQDLLNKGAKARMNTPASIKGNWVWRLKPEEFNKKLQTKLLELVRLYGR